jgi:hypothetical protein
MLHNDSHVAQPRCLLALSEARPKQATCTPPRRSQHCEGQINAKGECQHRKPLDDARKTHPHVSTPRFIPVSCLRDPQRPTMHVQADDTTNLHSSLNFEDPRLLPASHSLQTALSAWSKGREVMHTEIYHSTSRLSDRQLSSTPNG